MAVDTGRLERNLSRMAAAAAGAGVALRPHAKTRKCLPTARRQLAHDAVGLTVATIAEAEAEALAADGCPSVFIACPQWGNSASRP
jgi:D-serine deaminase-like pyridoxal phosphate-dependent protein